MAVKFNVNKAYSLFEESGGKTAFPESLKSVLKYMQNDPNLNTIEQVAYFLATAKAESDYSLQRWEADYLCGEKGVPYKKKPCQRALNYYRSSDGKSNYYTKGVDKNGVPYFGRGLIQLTNKYNYERYGDLIGVDLVADGDKALEPKNSYKIASEYLKRRTWKYVDKGDLRGARISVNGGTKGVDRTNKEYNRWIDILKKSSSKFKVKKKTKKQRILTFLGYSTLFIGVVGFAVTLAYFSRTPTKK